MNEYIAKEDAIAAFQLPVKEAIASELKSDGHSEFKANFLADALRAVSDAVVKTVKKMPAADVVEVVHAHWEPYDACDPEENAYECTNCGFVLQLMEGTPEFNEYNGCPHCLARMDGDAHD